LTGFAGLMLAGAYAGFNRLRDGNSPFRHISAVAVPLGLLRTLPGFKRSQIILVKCTAARQEAVFNQRRRSELRYQASNGL